MSIRTRTAVALAITTAIGIALDTPALAHGQEGHGYGPGGYGPCPMHQGMMGPGTGMMGPGAGHHGTMGPGMGMTGPGTGAQPFLDRDLTADDVRAVLEHRLRHTGNDRLRVGKVEPADDDTIAAEIETVDGSLVERLAIDRHTGRMQRAR